MSLPVWVRKAGKKLFFAPLIPERRLGRRQSADLNLQLSMVRSLREPRRQGVKSRLCPFQGCSYVDHSFLSLSRSMLLCDRACSGRCARAILSLRLQLFTLPCAAPLLPERSQSRLDPLAQSRHAQASVGAELLAEPVVGFRVFHPEFGEEGREIAFDPRVRLRQVLFRGPRPHRSQFPPPGPRHLFQAEVNPQARSKSGRALPEFRLDEPELRQQIAPEVEQLPGIALAPAWRIDASPMPRRLSADRRRPSRVRGPRERRALACCARSFAGVIRMFLRRTDIEDIPPSTGAGRPRSSTRDNAAVGRRATRLDKTSIQ